MDRAIRMEFEGVLYQVMACGNAQADIFLDDGSMEFREDHVTACGLIVRPCA